MSLQSSTKGYRRLHSLTDPVSTEQDAGLDWDSVAKMLFFFNPYQLMKYTSTLLVVCLFCFFIIWCLAF